MLRTFRIALAMLPACAGLHAQTRYATRTFLSTTAPATVAAGQPVPLRAAVVDANGYPLATSGVIQFVDGSTNLGSPIAASGGLATLTVSLSAGSHNLRAQFSGDAGLAPSTSQLVVQTVVANACPQLVFTQSPASVAAGSNLGPVIVQVICGSGVSTVNLSAQGLSGFKPGSVTSATVVNGMATFNNLVLNTPGAYSLAATATGAGSAVSNIFTVGPTGPASVFTVTNAQDDGAGSLRDAVNQANNQHGGVITFQDGFSGTVALASPLPPIFVDLQVVGPGPRVVTISGGSQSRLFFIQAGTASVSGIGIADGLAGSSVADSSGIGIQNLSSSLVSIDNCIVTNHSTTVGGSFGAGLYNRGKMTITNTTISYNRSGSGAGIDNQGSLTIGNSVITGNVSANSAGGGGGILNEEGASLTIVNTTFSGNTAAENGGGLLNFGAVSIADSMFSRNEAHGADGAGGALMNQTRGTVSIARSTFSENLSAQDGGAIGNTTNANLTIANSTFAGNRAGGNGGALVNRATAVASVGSSTINGNAALLGSGIYNEGNANQLTIANSIVAGNANSLSNQPDDCQGCGAAGNANLIGGNPKLGSLQNNGGLTQTMLPLPGSPVIGAGASSIAGTTDQRGQPRLAAGSVDLGAVQTSYTLAFATQPQDGSLGSPIPTAVQLQEAGRAFIPAANLAPGNTTPLTFTTTLALVSGTGKLTGNVVDVDAASDLATFPALQADTVGTKTLRASVPGFASATSQPFTVSAAVMSPAAIVPTAGNGQSTMVNSDFATLLQATVRDANGSGVPAISVKFTVVSGASFAGGSATTVATTNSTGIATAAALTAGATPGPATVTASISGSGLQATFNLTVLPSPGAPSITAGGFLNGASFLTTPLAPNTIMAGFGTFPCSNSVSIMINGTAAEILSATSTQVNFTVPGTISGTSATVRATCGTLSSQTVQLPVASSAPGIFTITQSGKGQAAAINQNGILNNALNPAAAGQVVSLYVTGLGPYNAADADGLRRMSLPILIFVGGTPATVQYAGNAPGYTAGLQQVNLVVPAGISGLATPLTLIAGGVTSQAGVTLAVQ